MTESDLQAQIFARFGALPRVIIMRNTNGKTIDALRSGQRERWISYGLGNGSPDLVAIIDGRWAAFELKMPKRDKADPVRWAKQLKCHAAWRAAGAFVAVVHSVDEMEAAIARCLAGRSE